MCLVIEVVVFYFLSTCVGCVEEHIVWSVVYSSRMIELHTNLVQSTKLWHKSREQRLNLSRS